MRLKSHYQMDRKMTHESLYRGDLIEVKSPSDILATLDNAGTLDNLPFMPEMAAHCGRRFKVSSRADKICDTVNYSGSRRIPDAVMLDDLRCDGSEHDGCQAECRLFWKEAWLKKVSPDTPAPPPFSSADVQALLERAMHNTRSRVEKGGKTQTLYRCQNTDIPHYSDLLSVWDPRPYVREFTTGNVEFSRFVRVSTRAAVTEPLRKLGYVPTIHLPGTALPDDTFEPLNLLAGELVRVKSREEIAKTLTPDGRNKGLWFDKEMMQFCGKEFRVHRRVECFVNEQDGRLVRPKIPSVILKGAVCSGDLSSCRWLCQRAIYSFWRECWLERVEPAAQSAPKVKQAVEG